MIRLGTRLSSQLASRPAGAVRSIAICSEGTSHRRLPCSPCTANRSRAGRAAYPPAAPAPPPAPPSTRPPPPAPLPPPPPPPPPTRAQRRPRRLHALRTRSPPLHHRAP